MACDKQATGPGAVTGGVRGTVRSVLSGGTLPVPSARVSWNDSLLAVTDASGAYSIASLREGDYALRCSAPGHRDSTAQIRVTAGETTVLDFGLSPDPTPCRVYGEFQDRDAFDDSLGTHPAMGQWSDRQVVDAITGATLQTKTLHYEVPDRIVTLGDSMLAMADGFGQFWFRIRPGTYTLTGRCEGYESLTKTVNLFPGDQNYVVFFLPRQK
jgi:hypothetical protein